MGSVTLTTAPSRVRVKQVNLPRKSKTIIGNMAISFKWRNPWAHHKKIPEAEVLQASVGNATPSVERKHKVPLLPLLRAPK
jgi:hypothetical protein